MPAVPWPGGPGQVMCYPVLADPESTGWRPREAGGLEARIHHFLLFS